MIENNTGILKILIYLIVIILKQKGNENENLRQFNNKNTNTNTNFRQFNLFKKLKFIKEGVQASFKNDKSIIYAYSFSIPLSILHFIFAPDILTKVFGLIIFSLLIIFESLNTSIETTIDRIGLEYNYLSKMAKDIAAIPPAIISILFILSVGMLSYNIYLKYNKWKQNELKKTNTKMKEYYLINKYIQYTFKN